MTRPPVRMSIGLSALAFVLAACAAMVAAGALIYGYVPHPRARTFFYAPLGSIFVVMLPLHLIPFAVSRTRYAAVRRWHAVVCSALVGAASLLILYVIPVIDSTWHVIRWAGMVVLATVAGYELLRRVARSRLAFRVNRE